MKAEKGEVINLNPIELNAKRKSEKENKHEVDVVKFGGNVIHIALQNADSSISTRTICGVYLDSINTTLMLGNATQAYENGLKYCKKCFG